MRGHSHLTVETQPVYQKVLSLKMAQQGRNMWETFTNKIIYILVHQLVFIISLLSSLMLKDTLPHRQCLCQCVSFNTEISAFTYSSVTLMVKIPFVTLDNWSLRYNTQDIMYIILKYNSIPQFYYNIYLVFCVDVCNPS
jgi:hypothetical protein